MTDQEKVNGHLMKYIEKYESVQKSLTNFIENDRNQNLSHLINYISELKIFENKHEAHDFLCLISTISKHHHRTPGFFTKFEELLLEIKDQIRILSNSEIFEIFKTNKRLLLFLIETKIIILDQNIANSIYQRHQKYFLPEIKCFINSQSIEKIDSELKMIENFEEKRKIGENDSYLCQLIRDDMVDDFIAYVNKAKVSFCTPIESSIFETNSFLTKRKTTLIEYTAFFGSIKIFKYLYMNNAFMNPSLFACAVHGRNSELIHFLEEKVPFNSNENLLKECLIESIKCHHNELIEYFMNKANQQQDCQTVFSQSIHYRNYFYFPVDLTNKFAFYCLCKYNHFEIVKHLTREFNIDINYKIKVNQFFCFNDIHQTIFHS